MHWDDYRADAPDNSDRWATSDRGWLYLDPHEHPDHNTLYWRDDCPMACGNYLRYDEAGDTDEYHAGTKHYHAVAYLFRSTVAGFPSQRLRLPGGSWYATATDAKAAITRCVLEALLGQEVQAAF